MRAVIGLDWFYALLHTLPIDFTLQQAVSSTLPPLLVFIARVRSRVCGAVD